MHFWRYFSTLYIGTTTEINSSIIFFYSQVAVQNSFYKREFFGTGYTDFTVLEICLHKAAA